MSWSYGRGRPPPDERHRLSRPHRYSGLLEHVRGGVRHGWGDHRYRRSHAESWAALFNEYLATRPETQNPFTEEDYLKYVDGKPRYDGVGSFLESRGIELPEGTPEDPPERETVCGLGNRKNVRLVEELHRRGVPVAVITSSRNACEVLRSAAVDDLFGVKVDGNDSAKLGLAGKPMPDIFLEAARRLGVAPERTAVVEDALSGVEAGRRGEFGLVVRVDRGGQAAELVANGADMVVSDLGELLSGSEDD